MWCAEARGHISLITSEHSLLASSYSRVSWGWLPTIHHKSEQEPLEVFQFQTILLGRKALALRRRHTGKRDKVLQLFPKPRSRYSECRGPSHNVVLQSREKFTTLLLVYDASNAEPRSSIWVIKPNGLAISNLRKKVMGFDALHGTPRLCCRFIGPDLPRALHRVLPSFTRQELVPLTKPALPS